MSRHRGDWIDLDHCGSPECKCLSIEEEYNVQVEEEEFFKKAAARYLISKPDIVRRLRKISSQYCNPSDIPVSLCKELANDLAPGISLTIIRVMVKMLKNK